MKIVKKNFEEVISKEFFKKNLCFFILSGKRKDIITGLKDYNSVLHISLFLHVTKRKYFMEYSNSYICVFDKPEKWVEYYKALISMGNIDIQHVCFKNSFVNEFNLSIFKGEVNLNNYNLRLKFQIINMFFVVFRFFMCIIFELINYIMEWIIFFIGRKKW